MKHISVLLEPTISSLNIKEDGIYVDCTLGYAGHSSAILKKIEKGKNYMLLIKMKKQEIIVKTF